MYSVNYQEKDYNAIFGDYLRKAAANNLIYDDEEYIQKILHNESSGGGIENVLIMELAIHSEILTETYKNLTCIKDSYDLDKAQDEELDRLLEPFIKRHTSTHAIAEICFQKNTPHLDSKITIPTGTQLTSIKYPEIIFETIKEANIPPGTEKIMVTARCTTPGPQGNIPPNEFNTYNNIHEIQKIYNPQNAFGGKKQEDDDSYRQRGYQWNSINTRGTYMAIKDALESIETSIDYLIEPQWDGPGTTRIIIDSNHPLTLKAVYKALDNIRALDEEYTVISAEQKKINININAEVNLNKITQNTTQEKETLKNKIKNTLITYIEGGINEHNQIKSSLKLGENFTPHKAELYILKQLPHLEDVRINYPSQTIHINAHEKAARGEIHIEIQ